jgi:hypothetical protein
MILIISKTIIIPTTIIIAKIVIIQEGYDILVLFIDKR